jgi:pyridoxamine 5'-phosphate oxidase
MSSQPWCIPTAMKTPSPIEQFVRWFQKAQEVSDPCVDAITLATATADGKPSARIVLFKGLSGDGFCFYTNYESRKGQEIAQNPFASIVFYWPTLARQVRVEGRLEKLSPEESDQYFSTRPRGSQVGAWASLQSQTLGERKTLENRVGQFDERYEGKDIPRPPHWGGFRLNPDVIEFWQGREDRLHERQVFRRLDQGWQTDFLFP